MLWNISEEASYCEDFLLAASERMTDDSWLSIGWGEWISMLVRRSRCNRLVIVRTLEVRVNNFPKCLIVDLDTTVKAIDSNGFVAMSSLYECPMFF